MRDVIFHVRMAVSSLVWAVATFLFLEKAPDTKVIIYMLVALLVRP